MRFTVNRTELERELCFVGGATGNQVIPVLKGVRCEISGDVMSIVATDIDITITASIFVSSDGDGMFVIDHGRILSLVQMLEKEEIEFTVDESSAAIKCGSFNSKVSLYDAEQYPVIPVVECGTYAINVEVLKSMIELTSFAITKKDPKYQLDGILSVLTDTSLDLVATDGSRLAAASTVIDEQEAPFDRQLLPRRLITELAKLSCEKVNVAISGNHLVFSYDDDHAIISRIVENRFPRYETLLENDNEYIEMTVNRRRMISVLRRVGSFSHEKAHGVRIKIAGDLSTVESAGGADGSASETIAIECSGNKEITVNCAFMEDVLRVLKDDVTAKVYEDRLMIDAEIGSISYVYLQPYMRI